jgi:hypothetical protein
MSEAKPYDISKRLVWDAWKQVRLLLGSGVLGFGHATKAAIRAPSRALPRRRALCTNWKKPR